MGRRAMRAPLRRCKARAGAYQVSPPDRLPLVRFVVVRSVDMHRTSGLYWIPRSRLTLAISGGVCGFSSHAVLRALANTDSSSRRLRAPSESSRFVPASGLPARSAFLGVASSLFATSATRVVAPGFQARHLSVLGVSHALDGFIREWPCGFISPRSHVQGSPSRGFPSRTAEPVRHRPVPSRRLTTVDYCSCPQRHLPSPRPQGFESVRRVRCLRTSFIHCADPIPSWAFPPPGAQSPNRGRTSNRPPSAHDVGLSAPPTAS